MATQFAVFQSLGFISSYFASFKASLGCVKGAYLPEAFCCLRSSFSGHGTDLAFHAKGHCYFQSRNVAVFD